MAKTNIIKGNPVKAESGQVVINKKSTKENLDELIEINNSGLDDKTPKVTSDASAGGLLKGDSHKKGGMPTVVDGVKKIEIEGDEFIVNKKAAKKHWKELSKINQKGGGVPILEPTTNNVLKLGGNVGYNRKEMYECILKNGFYSEVKTLNIFKNPDNGKIINDISFFLLTYNSGGQSNLKVTDTVNPIELSKNISNLINATNGIGKGIISYHLLEAKKATKKILDLIKYKNVIIADRDVIVYSILKKDTMSKGGTLKDIQYSDMEFTKKQDNLEKSGLLKKPKSIAEIANKHNVSTEYIEAQLLVGQEIEKEHTNYLETAKTIAKHHLWESPNYYIELNRMENKMEKGGNVKENIEVNLYGKIDDNNYEVIGLSHKLNLVRVKDFKKGDLLEMSINEWIPYTFELGTPVYFIMNNREVSGAVVKREGKLAVSLYKDENYSGDSSRIIPFSKIDLKTVHGFIEKEKFDNGETIEDTSHKEDKTDKYDYNNPISLNDVSLKVVEQGEGFKVIKFSWKNSFYKWDYRYSTKGGRIHIIKYPTEKDLKSSGSSIGTKEELIYNTYNKDQCTNEGVFIEYSIMKWDKNQFFKNEDVKDVRKTISKNKPRDTKHIEPKYKVGDKVYMFSDEPTLAITEVNEWSDKKPTYDLTSADKSVVRNNISEDKIFNLGEPLEKDMNRIKNNEAEDNLSVAIQDVISLRKYGNLDLAEAKELYSLNEKELNDNDNWDYEQNHLTVSDSIKKSLYDMNYITTSDETGKYIISSEGSAFIGAVNARIETIKSVSEGTDLFPEEANITKHNPETIYRDIKSCLLEEGEDEGAYIFEGKEFINKESGKNERWKITNFYKYGVNVSHLVNFKLTQKSENAKLSFDEIKSAYKEGLIEIDGIDSEKTLNHCIKILTKCIDLVDANKSINSEKESHETTKKELKNYQEEKLEAARNERKVEKQVRDLIYLTDELWTSLGIESADELRSNKELQLKFKNEFDKFFSTTIHSSELPLSKKVYFELEEQNEHSLNQHLALIGAYGEDEKNKWIDKISKTKYKDSYLSLDVYFPKDAETVGEENNKIKSRELNKGDRFLDNKKNKYGIVKNRHKPQKGSALENEPYLIDVKYDDGTSGINLAQGDRFVFSPNEESSENSDSDEWKEAVETLSMLLKTSKSEDSAIIKKLKSQREKLKERHEKAKENSSNKFNNLGWGAGMRKSKLNVSFVKEDKIRDKIKSIDERIDVEKNKNINPELKEWKEAIETLNILLGAENKNSDYDKAYENMHTEVINSNKPIAEQLKIMDKWVKENAPKYGIKDFAKGGNITTHAQYESVVLETVGKNNYLRVNGDSWKLTENQVKELNKDLEAYSNPLTAAEYLVDVNKDAYEKITMAEGGNMSSKEEYNKMLRDYDKLTGLYEDELNPVKRKALNRKIQQLEKNIHTYERGNLMAKGGNVAADKHEDIERKIMEEQFGKSL